MSQAKPDRRRFLVSSVGLVGAATLTACKGEPSQAIAGAPTQMPAPTPTSAPAPNAPTKIRVASVPTAVEGNLLPTLVAEFEKSSSYRVELVMNPDLYNAARAGHVDLAISHYGHRDAEQFVMDGLGEWPRMVFSNQMALVGPVSDPAKIRGLGDVVEAFRRIAATNSQFVMNDIDGIRYLVEVLWNAAGKPERAGWLRDYKQGDALREAAKLGAYTFWGLTPFLRTRRYDKLALEPLVLADPMLQRMLVSIVMRPDKIAGVNVEGAHAFQQFLLAPTTQARIRQVRYSDEEPAVFWVPAGRHNRTAVLPRV
jgi:tungstate transport system substrate-binding protein